MHKEFNIIDNYYALLKNLDEESKLELIARLSDSLIRKRKKNNVHRLFGAFQSDMSAEEIIKSIRLSRKFNRITPSL